MAVTAAVVAASLSTTTPATTSRKNVSTPKNRELIVNGQVAPPDEYPFFAISGEGSFILASDSRCGASLIHADMLLSAAHCQGAFNYETFVYNPISNDFDREVQIDAQCRYLKYGTVVGDLNYDIMVRRASLRSFIASFFVQWPHFSPFSP